MNNQVSVNNQKQELAVASDVKVYGGLTLQDIKKSNLSASTKEIALACFSEKKIKDLDANFAGEKLKSIINLTIFESGFKADNISELIILIIKDIFAEFSFLTISEVKTAFRKGVRGDFMGLSVRTFYNWLKEYNEVIKLEAIQELQRIKKQLPPQKTKEEEEEINRAWLNTFIEDFEKYKKSGHTQLYDFNNFFYQYCIDNGIGFLSAEEKNVIKEKARTSILRKHSLDKARGEYEKLDYQRIVSSIINNKMNKTTEQLIVEESKRLALLAIYDKLIESNLELKDLIEQAELINKTKNENSI